MPAQSLGPFFRLSSRCLYALCRRYDARVSVDVTMKECDSVHWLIAGVSNRMYLIPSARTCRSRRSLRPCTCPHGTQYSAVFHFSWKQTLRSFREAAILQQTLGGHKCRPAHRPLRLTADVLFPSSPSSSVTSGTLPTPRLLSPHLSQNQRRQKRPEDNVVCVLRGYPRPASRQSREVHSEKFVRVGNCQAHKSSEVARWLHGV